MPSILLVDNFDSFTFNLYAYLTELGASCTVVRNTISPSELNISSYSGIVLSPGPGTPATAGHLLAYTQLHLPILGVCLGHQALGVAYGATLLKAPLPMHGKCSTIQVEADPLFDICPSSFTVVRYHSLVLDNLPDMLRPLAWASDGTLMAFRHRVLPHFGVQYHPEAALTEYGYEVIANWLKIAVGRAI